MEKLFHAKPLANMTDDALRGLMGREVSQKTAREMLQKAGKEVTEDTVAEAAERLTRAAGREATRRNVIGEVSRRGLAGMATEGTTEGLQEATKIGAGSLSQGQGLSELATPQALGQIGESMLGGALVGGTFGGIGGTYRGFKRAGEAEHGLRASALGASGAARCCLKPRKQMADEAAARERDRRWHEQQEEAERRSGRRDGADACQPAGQARCDARAGVVHDPNANA
jgi:hypothetical protein